MSKRAQSVSRLISLVLLSPSGSALGSFASALQCRHPEGCTSSEARRLYDKYRTCESSPRLASSFVDKATYPRKSVVHIQKDWLYTVASKSLG